MRRPSRCAAYPLCVAIIAIVGVAAMAVSAEGLDADRLNEALFDACERGDLEDVRRLLARGADVNAKGSFSTTPVMRAASNGHASLVQELLARGADVNARSWQGETALMDAAGWCEDDKVLTVLLDHGAKVNAASKDGTTALMRAARRGNMQMVSLLIKRGAHVNDATNKGVTALMMASEQNHPDTVSLLRECGGAYDIHSAAAVGDLAELQRYASAGGNVDSREKTYGRSLLWMACHNGHVEAARWLLDNRADIEARGPNGETPLHAAAASGHHQVVAHLLDRGAQVQAFHDGMSGTALHLACLYGHQQTVALLLDRGCDVDTRTRANNETPLMIAAASGTTNVIRLLLNRGAQVNAVDHKGRDALMKATRRLEAEPVRMLLEAGADVGRRDTEYRYTALHDACCTDGCPEKSLPIAALLVQKGAAPDLGDEQGLTPLDCAAMNGCETLTTFLLKAKQTPPWAPAQLDCALLHSASEGSFNGNVALLLIQAGASIDCRDAEGYSPLMHAVELCDIAAIRFFASQGADPKAKNSEGVSAIDIAKHKNQNEIVDILRNRR